MHSSSIHVKFIHHNHHLKFNETSLSFIIHTLTHFMFNCFTRSHHHPKFEFKEQLEIRITKTELQREET